MSALMWLLYLYLIREGGFTLYAMVVASFEWASGGSARPDFSEISPVLGTLKQYGIVALMNGAILILWARYNQHLYSGPDHLGPRKLVSVDDLAALYAVPGADVARWQQARIVVMRHGPDGRLIEVLTPGLARDSV